VGGAYPYFVACVLRRRHPFLSGEEGRASLEVVLAAYRSIRERRWVELPL
jgi:predicted dehydrogenase